MSLRSRWLQREGFTADTLGSLIKSTALNPALTLPLLLLARYTQRGRSIAAEHDTLVSRIKVLVYLGLAHRFSRWLDRRMANNWTDDTYRWDKEIVVITGGSDGIGAIVVRLLSEQGVKVAVLDIQPLTFDAPANVHYFECDITSASAITASAAAIRGKLGQPTVLINNAGFTRGKTILDSTESDVRLTFGVNTLSHYRLVQEFLPSMIAANHGMVVTVASVASYVSAPRMVDYCSSKAAALSFHEGLGAELATTYQAPRVRTVVVCQGYTRTRLFDGFKAGDGFLSYALAPETVAEAIVRAVLRGKSDHILLPAANQYFAQCLRGWPLWAQLGLRKDLAKLMTGYRGRQVKQPSEIAE